MLDSTILKRHASLVMHTRRNVKPTLDASQNSDPLESSIGRKRFEQPKGYEQKHGRRKSSVHNINTECPTEMETRRREPSPFYRTHINFEKMFKPLAVGEKPTNEVVYREKRLTALHPDHKDMLRIDTRKAETNRIDHDHHSGKRVSRPPSPSSARVLCLADELPSTPKNRPPSPRACSPTFSSTLWNVVLGEQKDVPERRQLAAPKPFKAPVMELKTPANSRYHANMYASNLWGPGKGAQGMTLYDYKFMGSKSHHPTVTSGMETKHSEQALKMTNSSINFKMTNAEHITAAEQMRNSLKASPRYKVANEAKHRPTSLQPEEEARALRRRPSSVPRNASSIRLKDDTSEPVPAVPKRASSALRRQDTLDVFKRKDADCGRSHDFGSSVRSLSSTGSLASFHGRSARKNVSSVVNLLHHA